MDHTLKVLSFFKGSRRKEPSMLFLQNGSLLLEKLIAASNGRYDIPIRSFTALELEMATSNFVDRFYSSRCGYIYRGSWEGRRILVKKFHNSSRVPQDATYDTLSGPINDIVITAQMSHHKNVLKLLGCCLEFKLPAPVYEYVEGEFLLVLLLKGNINNSLLSWRSRLKISNYIANAILYLHTAFCTPIIYRILSATNIIIDQCGVAKLFDFSFSILLPSRKLQVQDDVIGVTGYLNYEYYSSGIVSQKTDEYSFGVVLLVLLMGQGAILQNQEGEEEHIVHYVKECSSRNEWNHIVDPRITPDTFGKQQQFQAFLHLAMRCTQEKGKHRPDMTDAAKELLKITRYFQDC